jgi:hypothetical protein
LNEQNEDKKYKKALIKMRLELIEAIIGKIREDLNAI